MIPLGIYFLWLVIGNGVYVHDFFVFLVLSSDVWIIKAGVVLVDYVAGCEGMLVRFTKVVGGSGVW